jgi:hypothetical protein
MQVVTRGAQGAARAVAYNGSGCPAGMATSFYDEESMTLAVQFSDYALDLEPPQTFLTKNCIITVQIRAPAGMTYAITRVQYRGFAVVPPSARATLSTEVSFSGFPIGDRTQPIANRMAEPWVILDDVPANQRQYAACGSTQNVTIRTRLNLYGATPPMSAHLSLESLEGGVAPVRVAFDWRPCNS